MFFGDLLTAMGEIVKQVGSREPKTSDVDDHIANRYELKRRLGKGVSALVLGNLTVKIKKILPRKLVWISKFRCLSILV